MKSVDFVEKTGDNLPSSTNSTLSFFLYLFPTDLHFFFPAGVGHVSNSLTSQGNVNYRNCMVTQKWC